MSASPFTTLDTGPTGDWPLIATGSGPVGTSVRHLIDLSHFFAGEGRSYSDALTSETRRHIAGCLDSIEGAFLKALSASPVGRWVSAFKGPMIWDAVQRHPHILSPELMAHMRLRAAVSLLVRQSVTRDGDPTADAVQGTACLLDDSDPAVIALATALTLAEARWMEQGAGTMLADVPAEYFAELTWTTAAILGTALYRGGLAEQNAAMTTATEAAFEVLARHDEESGGFALASRLARKLRDRGRHSEMLGQALSERRYLLFAALAGELANVDMEAVLDVLVHGNDAALAALCKALGGTGSDYRHLILDLQIVRGERDDPALVRLASFYDDLREEDVAAQTEALRRPAALRAKLAMIPAVLG